MTVSEAIQHANILLRADADASSTLEGVLSPRTREAIQKLITVATEATFSPAARRRLLLTEDDIVRRAKQADAAPRRSPRGESKV